MRNKCLADTLMEVTCLLGSSDPIYRICMHQSCMYYKPINIPGRYNWNMPQYHNHL